MLVTVHLANGYQKGSKMGLWDLVTDFVDREIERDRRENLSDEEREREDDLRSQMLSNGHRASIVPQCPECGSKMVTWDDDGDYHCMSCDEYF